MREIKTKNQLPGFLNYFRPCTIDMIDHARWLCCIVRPIIAYTLVRGIDTTATIISHKSTATKMSSPVMKATILVLSFVSAMAQSQPTQYPGRPRPNLDYLGLLALLAIPGVIGIAAIFFINWGFVCNNPQCGPPIVGTGPCSALGCANAVPCGYDGSCALDPSCATERCGPTCDCVKSAPEKVAQPPSNVQMTPALYVAEV